MINESVIPLETIRAYSETEFHVDARPPFTLRVGEYCEHLISLYKQFRAESCAYVTACNPRGETISDEENFWLQSELANELDQRSLKCFDGVGKHPDGDWPGEQSFLVLGISLETSKTLGIKLNQNAIIWCSVDAVPQLILLR